MVLRGFNQSPSFSPQAGPGPQAPSLSLSFPPLSQLGLHWKSVCLCFTLRLCMCLPVTVCLRDVVCESVVECQFGERATPVERMLEKHSHTQ